MPKKISVIQPGMTSFGDAKRPETVASRTDCLGATLAGGKTLFQGKLGSREASSASQPSAVAATAPFKPSLGCFPSTRETVETRQKVVLADGRDLEFFRLGPWGGKPVVLFDPVFGGAIDVMAVSRDSHDILNKLGVQVIAPCRPGSFGSNPAEVGHLGAFASDLEQLLDMIGLARVGVLSTSFGSGWALAVARELRSRIDTIVMSSACYPNGSQEHWRGLDRFFLQSTGAWRGWRWAVCRAVPFLTRSLAKNCRRHLDQYCQRSSSMDDIRILTHPVVQQRVSEMLALRIERGVDGVLKDDRLSGSAWDFDPSDIPTPTEIYQGPEDDVAPFRSAEALCARLPNATMTRMFDCGHFHHLENWPWLVARAAGRDVGPESLKYRLPDA